MSKVKITFNGDKKLTGYLVGALEHLIDPDNSPLTKITVNRISSPDHCDGEVIVEVESRI